MINTNNDNLIVSSQDRVVVLEDPRTINIITGLNGSGKTELLNNIQCMAHEIGDSVDARDEDGPDVDDAVYFGERLLESSRGEDLLYDAIKVGGCESWDESVERMGYGIRRLIGIAWCLHSARGGTATIDGIDTGLHGSVMRPLWDFIIEFAKASGTRIFATSHGYSIRAISMACTDEPEIAALYSLSSTGVTRFGGDELEQFYLDEIDVR